MRCLTTLYHWLWLLSTCCYISAITDVNAIYKQISTGTYPISQDMYSTWHYQGHNDCNAFNVCSDQCGGGGEEQNLILKIRLRWRKIVCNNYCGNWNLYHDLLQNSGVEIAAPWLMSLHRSWLSDIETNNYPCLNMIVVAQKNWLHHS